MSTRVYSPYHMIAVCSSKGVITPVYYVCITVYNIWIYNYIMNMLCMYVCMYIYIYISWGPQVGMDQPLDLETALVIVSHSHVDLDQKTRWAVSQSHKVFHGWMKSFGLFLF